MTARNYGVVTDLDEARELAAKLLAEDAVVGFDVETGYSGPDWPKRSLDIAHPDQFVVGFSVTNDSRWARYLPLRHDVGPNLPVQETWKAFAPVLEQKVIAAHHKKFEDRNLIALQWKGDFSRPILTGVGVDTMLQAYTLAEYQGATVGDGISSATGLKTLTRLVLGEDQAEIFSLFLGADGRPAELTAKQRDSIRFNVLPSTRPDVVAYACDDAALCLDLNSHMYPRIESEPRRKFIYLLEMQISALMAEAESRGVHVDWARLAAEAQKYVPFRDRMQVAVRTEFSRMTGRDQSGLALSSAPQMRELLYTELGMPCPKFTNTGAPSTDKIALEALSQQYPVIRKLLEVRQVDNLGKRMQKWLNEYTHAHDKRVHATFSQVVVASGRFAAKDPAIQQLPKDWGWSAAVGEEDDHEGNLQRGAQVNPDNYWLGNFRNFITAPPGHTFLTFDYSAAEMRVLAGVTQEKRLLRAFADGEDIHTVTASEMLGVPLAEVRKDQRQQGKMLNFALMYGMGPGSLANRLAISLPEAQALFSKYFAQFTSVEAWISSAKAVGKARGFTETPFGRKITVWEYQSSNPSIKAKGDRVAVNVVIQGGAADYAKIAMVRAKQALQQRGWWGDGVMLVMNQHDSLTFEVRNDMDVNEVRMLLQNAVSFPVPGFPEMVVDWEVGKRWGSSQEWPLGERASFFPEHDCWFVTEPLPAPIEVPAAPTEAPAAPVPPPAPEPSPAPQPAPTAPPGASTEPQAPWVEVHCRRPPTEQQVTAFVNYLRTVPGDRQVRLVLPDGTSVTLPFTSGVGPHQRGLLSQAIGGADVQFDLKAELSSAELTTLSEL